MNASGLRQTDSGPRYSPPTDTNETLFPTILTVPQYRLASPSHSLPSLSACVAYSPPTSSFFLHAFSYTLSFTHNPFSDTHFDFDLLSTRCVHRYLTHNARDE